MKKYFLLGILLIGIQQSLISDNITIQNLNEKYDLVKKRVSCMFQDSKGFIWFGMVNGLYKFDQQSFTFLSSEKNGINGFPEADVSTIIEIEPGFLLIGTHDKGLLVYDSESMRAYPVYCDSAVDLSRLNVKCLYLDKKGVVWVGTYKGLYRIKSVGKVQDRFKVQLIIDDQFKNLANSDFMKIKESESGLIWFSTMGDISYYVPETNKSKIIPLYLATSSFEFLDKNRILIGFYGEGLKILDTETLTTKNLILEGISEKAFVLDVFKDSDSNIWVSISNEGLYFLGPDIDNPDLLHISNKNIEYSELNSNIILTINKSNDGTLWLSTEDGINTITQKKNYFQSYSSNKYDPNSPHSVGIRSLLWSKEDFVWAGSVGEGLKQFDLSTKEFENVTLMHEGKEIGNFVQAMIRDSRGDLWLGTSGEGIIRFSPETNSEHTYRSTINYRVFPRPFPRRTLLNDFIMCFLEDKHKNIWIGTWHGLSLIDSANVKKPDQSQIVIQNFLNNPSDSLSISNNTIMNLLEDNEGNIWVGTHAGINKIIKTKEGYRFSHNFKKENGEPLTEKSILCLHQSKNGKIWFSAQEGGIFLFDEKKGVFKEFDSDNAFFENIITSITEDMNGNLWLASNNGLCCLDQANYTFKIYTTDDGLISNDFLFSSNCKIGNTVCLGGNSGLTMFNPDSIEYKSFKPNLVFTDFRLFNKPVQVGTKDSPLKRHISSEKKITLNHNQNFLTIFFASLNYEQQKEIRYACKLEGLETSWNNLGKEGRATYTNLSPGNYIFKVKAFSSNDYTNVSDISLKIDIRPPFWKTTLAYFIYLLIFMSALIQTYTFFINREKRRNALSLERLNAKRMHEMDLMKLQFFTNISHEFRTPLTLLSAPLETLIAEKPEPNKALSYYQIMLKNVKRLTRLIDQLLDLRKIEEGHLKMVWEPGDIVEFIQKTFNTFQYYAEKRNINFTYRSDCSELYTYFDSDKLDKVLFNLFSNALKYTADNGSISLKLEEKIHNKIPYDGSHNSYLEIKLTDTGVGIPEESIDKLFKPFQQIEKNKPIGSNATGIGLSLTKELIDLHHGSISVESELDKGSTFTIYLPVYKSNPDGKDKSEDNVLSGKSAHLDLEIPIDKKEKNGVTLTSEKPLVLIVEDNQDMRSFLMNELQKHFSVIESENGKDGLEQAIQKIPDLIVSDIMMDKMDGIELCRKIKNNENTSHIPVILLTARYADDIKQAGYETGADDYIIKPFNIALLISRIKNLIEQRLKLRKLFGKDYDYSVDNIATNKIDSQFLERLNKFIEDNIDNAEYSPSTLASDMCMSKMQLYRKVSALTDQTVYNYIRAMRLNRAAELLLKTNMQISEVSLSVGYTEHSNFTRSFTKQFNRTPSQFVKEYRKK